MTDDIITIPVKQNRRCSRMGKIEAKMTLKEFVLKDVRLFLLCVHRLRGNTFPKELMFMIMSYFTLNIQQLRQISK
jgi:hypothetical protein